MKQENAKLLLGLGIGAAVGVAIGYLMVADNRRKLAEGIDHAVCKVKEGTQHIYEQAKSKADGVKEHVQDNINEMAEKVAEKTRTEKGTAENR